MAVPFKFVRYQGPVLRGMGEAALAALRQRLTDGLSHLPRREPSRPAGAGKAATPPALPGPEHTRAVAALPEELVSAYVRHVGGDPQSWRGRVPPHLFPQWAFPLTGKLVEGLQYPMLAAMNGGCRLTVNGSLPIGRELTVSGRLEGIDDDGRRAILDQRIATGPTDAPEAVVAHLYVFIPLGKADQKDGRSKDKPRVAVDAREIAFFRLGPQAGLDFAKLTGDFNPVHWVPRWARAFGFRNTILHGFSTMARAYEALARGLCAGDPDAIAELDVRFTRPLVLPARVGVYVRGDRVWVGDAPGGPAYLEGTFELRERGSRS